jgi:hypothetical protein
VSGDLSSQASVCGTQFAVCPQCQSLVGTCEVIRCTPGRADSRPGSACASSNHVVASPPPAGNPTAASASTSRIPPAAFCLAEHGHTEPGMVAEDRHAINAIARHPQSPGLAANVKPEDAASGARPWPSMKQPTVRTDRFRAPIPSAMRPWTSRQSGPQRDKVTHHGTYKKRPA